MGGEERCHFDDRTVAVDDDSFLILNNGRICTTQIDSDPPVESFAVYFAPGHVERAYGAMTLSVEQALERGDVAVQRSAEFLEALQPHDELVSPVLRYIRLHVLRGIDDEGWYDEQLHFLLDRMLAHRDSLLGRIDSLQLIRASTRREIYRRISLATDYLHSNYREQIDLHALGHGITPHQYLLRKRARKALRLLQTTSLDVSEIASSVGFSQRHALLRRMRRWTGLSPRQIRRTDSVAVAES